MKRWMIRMMFFPALLVVGISLHPALTVYAGGGETITKAILVCML